MTIEDLIDEVVSQKQIIFDLKKDNKILADRLKDSLSKSSMLMLILVCLQENIEFYKKFNYSQDENYIKGFNKAFELVERVIMQREKH